MKRAVFVIVLLISVFMASDSLADIIYLKDGKTYEGRVIKEDDEKIALKTTLMVVILSKDKIKAIERFYPAAGSRLPAGELFSVEEVMEEAKADTSGHSD